MGIQAVQTLCKGTRMFVSAALLRHAVPDKLVQNSQLKSEVNSSSYLKSVKYLPKCTALFSSGDQLFSRN